MSRFDLVSVHMDLIVTSDYHCCVTTVGTIAKMIIVAIVPILTMWLSRYRGYCGYCGYSVAVARWLARLCCCYGCVTTVGSIAK